MILVSFLPVSSVWKYGANFWYLLSQATKRQQGLGSFHYSIETFCVEFVAQGGVRAV